MSETEAAIAKAVADVMQKSAAVGEESMLIEATIVKCGWTEGDKGDSLGIEVEIEGKSYTDYLHFNTTEIAYAADDARHGKGITNKMKSAKVAKHFGLVTKAEDNVGKVVTGYLSKAGAYGKYEFTIGTGGTVSNNEEAEARNEDAW